MARLTRSSTLALLAAAALAGCGGHSADSGASTAAAITTRSTPGLPGSGSGNQAPTFASPLPTQATVGAAYAYSPTVIDPEGDALSYTLAQGPAAMQVDPTTGAVAWTPAAGDVGAHAVRLEVTDGVNTVAQSGTVTVSTTPATGGGLPQNATLTDLGGPPGGLPVISDLVTFDGRLFLMESLEPLGQFAAQVWSYDGTTFRKVIDDPTSQGYLRGQVIGGKLYIPDSDPNGLAPGIMWVLDGATASPRMQVIDDAVHNFDVVELGGALYTTGGLNGGESGLNRFDPATGRWTVVSRGSFSRLKYAVAYEGAIWSGKRPVGSAAELVRTDPATGQQQGYDILPGTEAAALCMEAIGANVYCTLGSSAGVAHLRLEPGGTITQLTGTSGALLYDFVQHSDGNIYAVGTDLTSKSFVYVSTDGVAFTRLIEVPDLRFGRLPSGNLDGRPSIGSYDGELYCGGSTTGRLYRVD